MINLKNSFLDFSLFGIGINNLSIIFIIFILSILIRGLFAKIVIFKIKKIINKTSNKIDDKIFNTLVPPLKLLPIIFFITFVSYYIKIDSSLGNLFGNIIQSLFTIFIFIDLWWFRMITMPRGRTRLSNCTKTKIWASSSTVKAQHNHFSSTRELGSWPTASRF